MPAKNPSTVNTVEIKRLLDKKKTRMKLSLAACAACTLCAESCFLFMAKDQDPQYMPSYKVIHSLGKLYKKRGNVDMKFLEKARDLVWENCVLCGRCYCPFGIDIPAMIAFTRQICRTQGICGVYPHTLGAPEEEYKTVEP